MKEQLILENKRARLIPLALENYRLLSAIASQPGLVTYSPGDIESHEGFKEYVLRAIKARDMGKELPFIIFDREKDRYAGSTRYMHIDEKNKVLHIGATWMGREFHGTGLNSAVKEIMLRYAFLEMDFEKVEFRIDERNGRSRRAVEKIGAQLEGILRKNVFLDDGFKRNTCCYGILREEWLPNAH